MQPGPLPRSGAQRRGRRKQKKKDILSDVLLGALEEIRTPDLLIRSQTLYPTELPAQVQDIYYHRHRGLSTVFAKKFKIFFAKQKRFFCPLRAAAGGPFFRPQTDSLLAPPCARGCPRAACGVPCTLRWPPCALRCPPCALGCPRVAWGILCALGGVPLARSGGVLCALQCSLYALALLRWPPSALRAHHAPQYRARLSPASQQLSPPPSGGPLPRPAAALSPAQRRPSAPPRRTAEKKPGRSKRSGRALFISLSGDEAQVSDQALGLPNWQSLLPESEVHISSMFRGSL